MKKIKHSFRETSLKLLAFVQHKVCKLVGFKNTDKKLLSC